MHRLARYLVSLLVAAQLLLALPALASAQVQSAPHAAASDDVPCHDMPMAGDDGMPCCPDGTESLNDCLASCTLIAAIAPEISAAPLAARTSEVFVAPSHAVASLSEPPLKPPPIA